jgi:formamidopyrimidine-DNA glycosylase
MPELPDVESYRRFVQRRGLRRLIRRIDTLDPTRVEGARPADLARRLAGRSFRRATRHGKWLFLETDGPALALHFGMTGDLAFPERGENVRYARLSIEFADGARLIFQDQRRFGRISITDDPEEFVRRKELGPDAARIDLRDWLERLEAERGGVKASLLGQRLVAGLGNLWVDELLFQAGVHPRATWSQVGEEQRRDLFAVMKRILRTALTRRTPPASYLLPNRSPAGKCPRDGSRWRIATIAGRTTYWCPRHQRGNERSRR